MIGELYNYISNGPVVMLLCGAVILIVIVQALLFVRQAYRQGEGIGIERTNLNRIMFNSALFSVIPSIPILMVYVMLMPSMGKYFPWLRLTVVGSGTYEYLAANTAAEALGFAGMADPSLNPAAFITIMWVATICIMGGPITATLFLKKIDTTITGLQGKKDSFAHKIPTAMFVGMVATLLVPKALDFANPLGMVTFLISAVAVVGLGALAKKSGKRVLDDFAFPISMLIGMVGAIVLSGLF